MAKPASGTALDTGHALYTGLTAAWGLLEGTGTTSADSRGSRTLTLSGSGLWTTNGAGENIIRIASATAAPLTLASALALVGSGGPGSDWSIAFRAKQATSGGNGMVLGDNSNTNDFVWFNGGTALRFRDNATADCDFTGVTSFTATANYLLTWEKAAAKARLYKDGVEVNAGGIVAGSGTLNITHLGNGYTGTSLALVGDIEYVYVWAARLLTGSDASTLHANPYEIYSGTSPTPAVDITEPVAYQTFQRQDGEVGGGKADVKSGGTYGGSPVALEASWAGAAYETVVATPAAGIWAAKLPLRSRGSGALVVRHTDDTAVNDTVTPVLVGDIFGIAGQSNAAGRGTSNQVYTGPAGWFAKRNVSDAWALGADPVGVDGSAAGSVWPLLANRIVGDGATPVAFVNRAVGGTAISTWLTGQSNYTTFRDACLLASKRIKAVLWWQGETDAVNGVTATAYYNALVTLAANVWADLGCPLVVCKLQNCTDGSAAAGQAAINSGIARAWAECPYVRQGPDLSGITTDDGFHLQGDAKLLSAANLWWDALRVLFYAGGGGGGRLVGGGLVG